MSPRIGFDYRWNPNVMAYVSAAEGFKGGGFNGRSGSIDEFNEFTTEKVWTYELGLRSDWFDRRLRLNATAFYSDYTELQIATSFSKVVNGVPTPSRSWRTFRGAHHAVSSSSSQNRFRN